MTITPRIFEAFLKCPTKCWLRTMGEQTAGNTYAEWVQTQNESYRADAAKRLTEGVPADECALAPAAENLKSAKWRLAVDLLVRIPDSSSPEAGSSRGHEAQTSTAENNQSLLTSAATNDQVQRQWTTESRLHAVEHILFRGPGQPRSSRRKEAHFIFREEFRTCIEDVATKLASIRPFEFSVSASSRRLLRWLWILWRFPRTMLRRRE